MMDQHFCTQLVLALYIWYYRLACCSSDTLYELVWAQSEVPFGGHLGKKVKMFIF